jgi:hypothetical protein
MLGRSTSAMRQDAAEVPVSLASGDFCCFVVCGQYSDESTGRIVLNSNPDKAKRLISSPKTPDGF